MGPEPQLSTKADQTQEPLQVFRAVVAVQGNNCGHIHSQPKKNEEDTKPQLGILQKKQTAISVFTEQHMETFFFFFRTGIKAVEGAGVRRY